MQKKYSVSFIKDNLITTFGVLIISLKSIILMPIIIKSMGVFIYGGYVLFITTLTIIFSISTLGVGLSAKRYLPSASTTVDRQRLFFPQFFFGLMAILVVSTLLLVFNERISLHLFNNELEYSGYIFPCYLFAYFFYSQGVDYFRYTSRIKLITTASSILPYLHIGIVLFFLYLMGTININQLVLAEVVSALFIGIMCFIKIFKEIKLRFIFYKSDKLLKEMKLGFPLMLNIITDAILAASDRYIIAIFLSLSAVGYYNPAYLLGSLIMVIPKATGLALPQLMSKAIDAGDQKSAESMFNLTIKVFLMLAIPFVFGSLLLSKFILTLLTNAQVAQEVYILTPIVATGIIFFGLTYIMTNILFVQLRTGLMLKVNLIAAGFNLGANITLLYYFRNLYVPALTTLASYFISFVYLNYKIAPNWTISYNPGFIFKVFLASVAIFPALFYFVPYVEQSGSIWLAIAFILAAISLYAGFLYLFKIFSKSDIEQVKKLLGRKVV